MTGERKRRPGVVRRPKPSVLSDDALVPEANLIRPPPNRFTHELAVDEPYRFDGPEQGDPVGVLGAGTPVVLLAEEPDGCRVVDGRGLYVRVRCASLRPRG